jgi:outer membrane receptor protein involved in Fe transport
LAVLVGLTVAIMDGPGPTAAADRDEEAAVTLPSVVVTAPAPLSEGLPREWVPGAVDVLSGRDGLAGRPAVLPDALERRPGVTLQNEQGTVFQPGLTLRGFTTSPVTGLPQGISVFLDGVRLNEPTVEEVNFDLIPLEDVERIEVIRGPSVLFGRNTLGGAINIITRRGTAVREIVPEVEAGSFGRQVYRVRASGEARPLDYYVSLNQVQDDGYRDFAAARLSRAFVKLGAHAGGLDTTLSYQFSNDRIHQAGSLPPRELGRDRATNFTAGDFFAPELHQAILNGRYALSDQVTLEANAFVRDLSVEQFNVNAAAANSRLFNHARSVGGRLQASYQARPFGLENVLTGGLEYTRHDVTSRTFLEAQESRELDSSLADIQGAAGVYLQSSLALARGFAGPRSSVVITVAGRWDLVRHRIDDRLGGPSAGTHTFSNVNPRTGINVNLTEHTGAFASFGEGTRAPAFLELTCAGPGAVCPGLQAGVAPDPPLKAVKTRTYEVGLYARPTAWLDLSLTAYRTDVRDDIFAVSPTGTTGIFFQNVGRTRRQGIEASGRARAGNTLEVRLNYAYTEATFQDGSELATPVPPGTEVVPAGRSFALVPRHRVNAGFTYRPWPWLALSLDGRYVSPQFLRGDEVNRQAPLAGYWVLDGGVTVTHRAFQAFAKVNNLLDNRYETFGTFAPNNRVAGTPVERFLTPAPPINFVAGLQYAF